MRLRAAARAGGQPDPEGAPLELPPLAVPQAALEPAPRPAQAFEGLAARAQVRAAEAALRADAGSFAEVKRILSLPITSGLAPEEKRAFDASSLLATSFDEGFRWFDCQAETILAYLTCKGAVAPIPVGRGKTLVSLAIADAGARFFGIERSILLVPASVYPQLASVDIAAARDKIPLSISFHLLGQKDRASRRALAASGRPGCYVVPYSLLSGKDAAPADAWQGLLTTIDAGLVIADEGHYLKNKGTAARTRRFFEWASVRRPHFVVLSGTLTSRTLKDYRHLVQLALGEGSPLPLSPSLCDDWAQVVDSDAPDFDATNSSASESLRPIVDWARTVFPSTEIPFGQAGFRMAYRLRMNSAPGVIQPVLDEIGTSITICNDPVKHPEKVEGWERLEELNRQVVDEWKTPNGDEIEDAIQTYKWLRELTVGFYNELVWPSEEQVAGDLGFTPEEAKACLERAKEHHAAKQTYVREGQRDFLKEGRPGLDTPMLLGHSMATYGAEHVPQKVYELWREMKALEFEGMPKRFSRAVRVCPFKIRHAVEWVAGQRHAQPQEGVLVWYLHRDIGKWLVEEMAAAGLDPLHCPAGNTANRELTETEKLRDNEKRVVVLSMKAHHEGKNLQGNAGRKLAGWGLNFFVEWPRPEKLAEQALGRTHRVGQTRDELRPVTCITTDFDVLAMAATLNDSLYVQQTTGNRRKLIYAGYDPLPEVVPPALLKERGFQPKQLDQRAEHNIQEKFGAFR